jgi:hypothetical protein
MHTDMAFRTYLGWYHRATRIELCQRWIDDDYVDSGSSDDKDTIYDKRTREGSHAEQGPILDRVVCCLPTFSHCCNDVSFYYNIECCRVFNADDL